MSTASRPSTLRISLVAARFDGGGERRGGILRRLEGLLSVGGRHPQTAARLLPGDRQRARDSVVSIEASSWSHPRARGDLRAGCEPILVGEELDSEPVVVDPEVAIAPRVTAPGMTACTSCAMTPT